MIHAEDLEVRLKAIRPRTGDLVVAEMPTGVSPQQMRTVLMALGSRLPQGCTILVLSGTSVSQVSRADWRRYIAEAKP